MLMDFLKLQRVQLARTLAATLPPRGKRLVFLVSLASRLNAAERFDEETRHKLNQVLQLAAGDGALVLPYELREVIWHGKTGKEIFQVDPKSPQLSSDEILQMAKSAIDSMPSWLRYGDSEEINQDIARLLQNRQTVFGF